MDITIFSEFKNLIPPLSDEEFLQLEKNIVEHGIRDPLVVWKKLIDDAGNYQLVLVDGHNRYEIASKNGLKFEVVEIQFSTQEEAEDWMDKNQIGRRNLTPDMMSYIRGRMYNRMKKAKNDGGKGTSKTVDQNDLRLPTADKIAQQTGVAPATIKRDEQYFKAVETVAAAINKPATHLIKDDIANKKQMGIIAEKIQKEPEKAQQVIESVITVKAHVSNNSGENEWYTPERYIQSALLVMGSIDLDPASSEIANQTVKAKKIYTQDENGLEFEWIGNVWMNPPYAQPLINQFIQKLKESPKVEQAVILVNNATETMWGQNLLSICDAVCFHSSRIRFVDPYGNLGQAPLQGQMICYKGKNVTQFINEFSKYGICFKSR